MTDLEQQALERIEKRRRRPVRFADDTITMAHGAGGKATQALVAGMIAPAFADATLAELDDGARIELGDTELVLTTDSFVVRPLRFPGGSIGALAVNGTVNDLAVCGARPTALAVALVLEEGLDANVLSGEIDAMAAAARVAGVRLVTGDTKVVERGKADGMYVTTTGVGMLDRRAALARRDLRPGDRILLSGPVGDHGTAILLARGELDLEADVVSDTAPLWPVADALLGAAGSELRAMRDATRGGVATVLNELAAAAGVGIVVDEAAVPVRPAVQGACEILGIDPMYVANEGRLVAVVAPSVADAALDAVRALPAGSGAALIGRVGDEPAGMVLVRTAFGGTRIMDMLVGDPLPRIC